MSPVNRDVYSGLSNAAWGYFFLHFDFNLNNVSIFPRFVGWLLLLSACKKLSGERRDLALLRPLAVRLAAWYALDWLLSWGGGDVNGHILFLDLLLAVAGLYFHFQFLTDMAALAERYQPEGAGLDEKLRGRRTIYVVLTTLAALLGDLNLLVALPEPLGAWIAIGLALTALIAAFMIRAALFRLRRFFREGKTELPVL